MMSQTGQLSFIIYLQERCLQQFIYYLMMAIWPFLYMEQTGKDKQQKASTLKEYNVLSWFGPDNICCFTCVYANICTTSPQTRYPSSYLKNHPGLLKEIFGQRGSYNNPSFNHVEKVNIKQQQLW